VYVYYEFQEKIKLKRPSSYQNINLMPTEYELGMVLSTFFFFFFFLNGSTVQ